jgi:hypothetical protein
MSSGTEFLWPSAVPELMDPDPILAKLGGLNQSN